MMRWKSYIFIQYILVFTAIPKLCTGILAGAFYRLVIGTITFKIGAGSSISNDAFGEVIIISALTLPETIKQIDNSVFYSITF